ncbi:MAG: MATE family efflux transporter [Clostridia bacterium]|nr:MATE family efflux transporter [Clostridia bacterium]
MNEQKTNKMADTPMKKLFWKMGLPMIISMVLQALYNVVDSIFVTNMGAKGAIANQALTIAFPIQILIIAIGVGTGVGLNALLSKSLGEKNQEKVNKVAGNGIFLSICIFAVFLLFGAFGARWFIGLFAGNDLEVVEMGTTYLQICCCFSLGAIGFTVYERFLQSTGKTMLSTIAQISGAVTNIVLDYVFIYPLNMGVAGAAWATIIGQFVSLGIAMIFHYLLNKEINGNPKYIKPDFHLIQAIYQIGISAALMQALLSVMMAGMNAILGMAHADPTVLVGSFGIYYKIQQIALFSAFGLSNTIISILSFNYGMRDRERVNDCIKYGIVDTLIVTFILTCVFEVFARPLANLFGLAGGTTSEIIVTCTTALRIASIGYVFMGFSVAVQGVLQSLGYALRPLIISLLRLVIFVFPIAFFFTRYENVVDIVWWTFPIAEILTALISVLILKKAYQERVETIDELASNSAVESKGNAEAEANQEQKIIISISREHGTGGKEIAKNVAEKLHLKFYDKEAIKNYAVENALKDENYTEDELYQFYLSLDAEKDAIIKQADTIRKIAEEGNCVIVGRGSDYILKDDSHLIRIFLYAPLEYRVSKIKEMYHDTYKDAKRHVLDSDKSRAAYHEVISNQPWGDKKYYDLCLNCEIGNEKIQEIICDYVQKIKD